MLQRAVYKEPRWRVGQAEYELRCESDGRRYTPSDDLLVIQLKQLMRAERAATAIDQLPWFREELGPISRVIQLYRRSGPSCLTHALEAAVLAGADYEFIRRNITDDLGENDFRLYQKWFFDVEENLDRPFWIDQYVFAPASMIHGEERTSGYAWKVVAYREGPEALLYGCMRGRKYPEEHIEKFRRACMQEGERSFLLHYACGGILPSPEAEFAEQAKHRTMVGSPVQEKQVDIGGIQMEQIQSCGRNLHARLADANLSRTELVPTSIGSAP